MIRNSCLLCRLVLLLSLPASHALCELTPDQVNERARRVEDQLLSPCCYSEALTVHRSDLAAQLRTEIRHMVEAGRSDREILDIYIARYGLRVLREPEGARRTWLNGVAIGGVLLGLLIAVVALRRLRRPLTPQPAETTATPPPVPEDDLW